MSSDSDSRQSAIVRAVAKAIKTQFDEDDWLELALETDTLELIQRHPRLLRSLRFGDKDYLTSILEVLPKVLGKEVRRPRASGLSRSGPSEFANFEAVEKKLGLRAWLQSEDPKLFNSIYGPTTRASTSPSEIPTLAAAQPPEPPSPNKPSGSGVVPMTTSDTAVPPGRKVFLVHGRNDAATAALTEFLEAVDLKVISWTEASLEAMRSTRTGTPSTLAIVQAGIKMAAGVVVLFTPDDVARLHPSFLTPHDGDDEKTPTGQARQNVTLEAGMALAAVPDRTLFVSMGKIRQISDIAGINFVRLSNDIGTRRDLASRLEGINLAVEANNEKMRTAGNFELDPDLSGPPPFDLPSSSSPAAGRVHVDRGQSSEVLLRKEIDSVARSAQAQGWRVKTLSETRLRLICPHKHRIQRTFVMDDQNARDKLRDFARTLHADGLRLSQTIRTPVLK